jgi:hypothetical protein
MARKAKDTALGELTLRKYEPPGELDDRELVRKLCLSLGVLQPGDSRDVVVDILLVLLRAKEPMASREIEHAVMDAREAADLPMLGVAPSNIRRQLLRLRDVFLLEKVKNTYRLRENASLQDIFNEHFEQYFMTSVLARVKEYLSLADQRFGKTS